MFTLQDEIAHAVVASLEPTLHKEPATLTVRRRISPEAYNFYLQGRFFWNKRTAEDFRQAIECFRKAIALDSSFAAAMTGIADSCITLAIYGAEAPETAIRLARESAYQALEIDARLAEAHTSLGGVAALHDWNWESAERHFQRAIESSPRYATAHQQALALPPEIPPPPSLTTVCIPMGMDLRSSSNPARRAASQASSMVRTRPPLCSGKCCRS